MSSKKNSVYKQRLENILSVLPYEFQMEHEAIKDRRYRIDYAVIDKKIAIEFEGGIFIGAGGHRSTTNFLSDVEKYNLLAINGWRLFRVTASDCKKENLDKLKENIIKLIEGI